MNKLISGSLISLFGVFLCAPFSAAEVITLPIGEQTRQSGLEMPQRSMHKETVRLDFGDPQAITDAVGEPPISSWVYADYVVYFEGNWVLYSVVKHPSNPDD
jgi:hypothetical protein